MKKIISIASLAISLAACLQPAVTPGQTKTMDSTPLVKDGAEETGKTEPSPTEENPDFIINAKGILTKYKGKAKVVTVPDGVIRIGSRAFSMNQRIEKVILPDTVTSIGEAAFEGSGIETINLSHVKVIEANAFSGCKSLKEVEVGRVEKIGNGAFYGCLLLKEIDLKNVEEIGDRAFLNCENLVSVTGLEHLKALGDRPFHTTPFLEHYGDGLGENPMLIINGILVLATDCSGVITIPDEVKEIGGGAFAGSAVTKVVIPEHVTKIGRGAFADSELSSVNIPDGIRIIEANTFADTKKLLEIVLPDSVEEIGDQAFGGSNLMMIDWSDNIKIIGDQAFGGTDLVSVVLPGNVEIIGDAAFSGTEKLKVFSMKDSVVQLGASAFEGSGVEDIRLSHNLTEIKEGTFGWCYELRNLTLPAALEKLNSSAFIRANKPKTVTIAPWADEDMAHSLDVNENVKTVYTTELTGNTALEKRAKEAGWGVAELALATNRVHLGIGTKFALRFNSGAKAEKWKSSNKKVVTVDSVGNLYAKGAGRATVTAIIYGKEYQCEVTVK
ncbi:MAG: leucine-rich repeat protein [Lachnospiraceae bacterium]|nr:leucine-rich repeat protein [Lachnospiraceae bacterium]